MKIILASASPRRKELLHMICEDFEIITSDKEEKATLTTPDDFVMTLSKQKAENVLDSIISQNITNAEMILIGADTIVYQDGEVLGKPRSYEHAYEMIQNLSGKNHQVYTGVTLLHTKNEKIVNQKNFAVCTQVYVDTLTDAEIKDYLSSDEYKDKAGSYGIQGLFGKYITKIDGDYYNVVGLPVNRLYQELKEWLL